MKKYRRFANLIASAAIIASIAAVPMSASAATTYSSTLTTIDALKTTTLDKYLVMKADANVPNAQFTFSVTSGAPVTADKENGTLAVLAGVGTPVLTNSTMTFSTADTATLESAKGTDTPVFLTEDTSDEKYVKQTLTLDFSGVKFTEPGVYRYIITETGTNQGVTNGYIDASTASTDRTLDVYVKDAGTTVADGEDAGKPQLMIEDYVMYNGKQTGAPKAEANETAAAPNNGAEVAGATKNNTITNMYSSQDLTFSKTVTGNQGSKDKYFAFTVEISGAVAGTVYDVSYADDNNANTTDGNADTMISAIPNSATTCITSNVTQPAALTVGNDGTVTQVFYLQHGQSIAIRGLAEGTSYTITEDPEDYSDSATVTGDTKTQDKTNTGTEEEPVMGSYISYSNHQIADTYISGDTVAAFTNDRSGVIPTGILTTVAGSLGIVAVGAVGVTCGMIYMKKKKSEDEEE